MKKEPLLISRCLLGEPCRYDGKRKTNAVAPEILAALSEKYTLIPVCPECDGGLPTPRTPSERTGERVLMKDGTDVTEAYVRGAQAALAAGEAVSCHTALLKARSPSCGVGEIYDGTFTGRKVCRDGVTAELLRRSGYRLCTEETAEKLLVQTKSFFGKTLEKKRKL